MPKRARRRIRSMIWDFSLALCISSLVMLAIPAGEAAAGFGVWKIATAKTENQAPAPDAARNVSWSASEPASAMPLYRHTNRSEAVVILILAISTLAAFNMWILRHLRRVHLSSRRVSKRLPTDHAAATRPALSLESGHY